MIVYAVVGPFENGTSKVNQVWQEGGVKDWVPQMHSVNGGYVIGVDEAQFFDDLYGFSRHAADIDRKIVIVAGLDGDFRRSFAIVKLTARCEVCCKKACFTLRKTQMRQTEPIGGSDIYMPACCEHYLQLQPDMEKEEALAKQII